MTSESLPTAASAQAQDVRGTAHRAGALRSPVVAMFAILLLACLLARLHLVFVYEINWDEFLNLSMVYEHSRGELHEVLQTLFVQMFFWLEHVSVNEVDQIVAARIVIYFLGLATAFFLNTISRNFMPAPAALFSVVSYLSFSFVLRQGNSFRTDSIAVFLLMAALLLIVCRAPSMRNGLIAGCLIGLAGMVTIKSIFYVPTIAIIMLARLLDEEKRWTALCHGTVTAAAAITGFVLFFVLHHLSFSDPASTLAFLERTIGKTLGEHAFGTAIITFQAAVIQNPLFWLMTLMGLMACARGFLGSRGRNAARWVGVAAFGAPLGSLLVYTESYAYYYPFILAPVAVLCGMGFASVPARLRPASGIIAGVVLGLALVSQYSFALDQGNAVQRRTLDVIHRAFPEPTTYIDRCSMVSSYPKRGFFMSVWGMTNYYRQGAPVMRSILEKEQPKFLIANRRMLELDDLGEEEWGPEHLGLFKEDLVTLKQNYVRHWGAIYVAGKQITLSPTAPSRNFEVLIEGHYTVESAFPVALDGRAVRSGDVVGLSRGQHRLEMLSHEPTRVTLRWGDHLYRPSEPGPEAPLFTGF